MQGWKQVMATSNLKSGRKRYVITITIFFQLDLVRVAQATRCALANFIPRSAEHNAQSNTHSRNDGMHGRMLARLPGTTLRLTSTVDESHITHETWR